MEGTMEISEVLKERLAPLRIIPRQTSSQYLAYSHVPRLRANDNILSHQKTKLRTPVKVEEWANSRA